MEVVGQFGNGDKMKYIENELIHCKTELRRATGERYSFLYTVQQALGWALDPMSYATPVDTVLGGKIGTMDIPLSSEDCLVVRRPLPSLDTCCHNGLPPRRESNPEPCL